MVYFFFTTFFFQAEDGIRDPLVTGVQTCALPISSSTIKGKNSTNAATTMPKMSPTCILAGVPPRICPTLRSCSISPATADETQTTAATPSTAATPPTPDTPNATINKAATTSVHKVKPETGLFDDPIMPTRFPDTAAKKNPRTTMTAAATIAPAAILLPTRL